MQEDSLAEVCADFVVSTEYQIEHDIVKLVEHHESEQVLVLRNVAQQTYNELEERTQNYASVLCKNYHNQIFHHMDYLGQALQVLEGWTRVHLIPIDLVVIGLHEGVLKDS